MSFEFASEEGVSPILFYDPLERVVATLHPNHTYEKVVFDPWRQATWDVNDTVATRDVNDTVLQDPSQDEDVGDFFRRLETDEYRPTWYERRTDDVLALERWPDVDPVTGQPLPENAGIRLREKAAAVKTAVHAETPTVTILDALGRPFLSIEHNRFQREDRLTGNIEIVEEHYTTRTELDIEGNPRAIIDARRNDQCPRQRGDALQVQHDRSRRR